MREDEAEVGTNLFRLLEHVLVDQLEDVPHLVMAVLLPNEIGLVDVAVTMGNGLDVMAFRFEPGDDRFKLYRFLHRL